MILSAVTELFAEGMELFRDRFNLGFDPANLPRLRDSNQFRTVFDRSMLTRRDAAISAGNPRQGLRPLPPWAYGLQGCLQAELPLRRGAAKSPTFPLTRACPGARRPYRQKTPQSAMANRSLISRRVADAGIKMIRGTYYFGDCWPVNVWDSFRPELADRLLKAIVDNGYNTVILLIPSGLELVQRQKPEYYDAFLADLRYMIGRIHASGLQYALPHRLWLGRLSHHAEQADARLFAHFRRRGAGQLPEDTG